MKMNKWQFLSGILFLLLNSCVANTDLSCGKVFANYINEKNVESGNFEAFMRQLVHNTQTKNAGKSCGSAANFVYYLMHKKNISEIQNSEQLKQDILDFDMSNTPHFQSKEELSQILNNEFLQDKENDARRTAVCYFQQSFKERGEVYEFPGFNHVFVIEKGGKDEFRLWQAWIESYSVLEWVRGQIDGETEPKDTTYTHRERPLSRVEAKHLVTDLVSFSDSNLDWNQRQELSAKMFWSSKNLFYHTGDYKQRYFDSNGKVSKISSCDEAFSIAESQLKERIKIYLDVPDNWKKVEEKRNANSGNCYADDGIQWLLKCNENIFSAAIYSIRQTYEKCYSDISKNIDLSNVPNLPKVEIYMNCLITTNPNNGAQCQNLINDIYKIIRNKSY